MAVSQKDLESLVQQWYVPSAIERKKSVTMYFLVWIIVSLASKKLSLYELFHLKQSLGWWLLFFVLMIASVIFFFIPYIRVLPIFFFFLYIILWALFVKQAWEWHYVIWSEKKIRLPLFVSLWSWIIDVFEISLTKDDSQN